MKLVDFAKATNMTTDDAYALCRKFNAVYLDGIYFKVDMEKINKVLDDEIIEQLKFLN